MANEEKNYAKRTAKDYHIFRTVFFMSFLWSVVMPVTTLMYNLKVVGKENLPKKGNFMLAGNHVSEMDPPFLACACNMPIAFMAKKELFEKTEPRNWLVKKLGAFSVDREHPGISTFKSAKEIFKTSWKLGIFPEGGTRKNKKIENIHNGFVALAKAAKADIVPVSISGFDGYAKHLFEKHITVTIGKPISYELATEEIVQQWCAEICKNTGFENCMLPEKSSC